MDKYFEHNLNSLPLASGFNQGDYSEFCRAEEKDVSTLGSFGEISAGYRFGTYSPLSMCISCIRFMIAKVYPSGEEFTKRTTVLAFGLPELWRIQNGNGQTSILASYGTDRFSIALKRKDGSYYLHDVVWLRKK